MFDCLLLFVFFLFFFCLGPEQKLLHIFETNSKNCRGLIQKRAHTVDDFMQGIYKFKRALFFVCIIIVKVGGVV